MEILVATVEGRIGAYVCVCMCVGGGGGGGGGVVIEHE